MGQQPHEFLTRNTGLSFDAEKEHTCIYIRVLLGQKFTWVLLPYLHGFCFHIYMDSASMQVVSNQERRVPRDNEPVYEPTDDDPIHEMTGLRTKAELRGGELCSTPQLFQSFL